MGEAKRRAESFVAEINQAEMACRIFEHMSGIHGNGAGRPYPKSPEKSMLVIKDEDPAMHARVMAAARAAIEYLGECVNNGRVPS